MKLVENNNWELINQYHFGGYGKVNEDTAFTIRFTQNTTDPGHTARFYTRRTKIPLAQMH
jgi:1-aminocyclopropane-1-carboxylate deaminase/D-cysteine desulfhydrase-like pyridoxal-dependent ACC family enzyme